MMKTAPARLLIGSAVEEHYNVNGKWVAVIREDLAYASPLPPNGKMSALYEIVKQNSKQYKLMAIFAKQQAGISYSIGLPYICQEFGVQAIIGYPTSRDIPDWLERCQRRTGVEVFVMRPNMITINVQQTKRMVEDRGGYFIPFGFDHPISVSVHSNRMKLPHRVGTLIMATMTGMVLAGAIDNINRGNKAVERIVGVSCGRDPDNVIASMQKYVDVPGNVSVVNPYDRHFVVPDMGAPIPLHPDYEAKAWYWMLNNMDELPEPICFVNIGH